MLADLFHRLINFFSADESPEPSAPPPPSKPPKVEPKTPELPNLALILSAITQAASEFVRGNLTPIAEYEPTLGYSVRTIRLLITPDNSKLMQEIGRMNPAKRDQLVASCIRKAQGSAKFKLDDFFGMTFVGNEEILDGQIVTILMYQDEQMAPLKFCFDGEYVDIIRDEKTPSPPKSAVDTLHSIILPERKSTAPSHETHLAPTCEKSHVAEETHLSSTPNTAIAKLLIRDYNGNEMAYYITQLPFEIGRELSDETSGYLLPDTLGLVSRQHLRLVERQGNSLLVENLAARKNGSFIQGQAQAPRFVWHYSSPSDAWLTLGSRTLDAESIQLRLEAA